MVNSSDRSLPSPAGRTRYVPQRIAPLAPNAPDYQLSLSASDALHDVQLSRSQSSEKAIRPDRHVSRVPSTSNLPEIEKSEYEPSRRTPMSRSPKNRARWLAPLAVFAGFCQQALSWGFIMIYGSQFTYYEDVLLPDRSRVELSLPGAIAPCLLLVGSMIVGRLCDAHYHRWINIFGTTFLVAGFFCWTFSSGQALPGEGYYGIIVLAYVLMGVGQSAFFVTSSQIASSWYPEKPALPIGITSCGVAVAGIIWPLMFTNPAANWGFRTAAGSMTGLAALLGIVVCVFGNPNPEQERRHLGPIKKLRTWIDPAALGSVEWIFATLSTCFIYLALLVTPQFMEDWAVTRNLAPDAEQAVNLLTISMGCSLIGRLGGSYIAGKLGFRVTHAAFNLAQMVNILCFWALATTWAHAIAFAVISGIFLGAIITLPPGGMKEVVSSAPISPRPGTDHEDPSTISLPTAVPSTSGTTHSSSTNIAQQLPASEIQQHPPPLQRSNSIPAMTAVAGSIPSDKRKTRLGQWLGTSFLCAAPFVLTGNLATSRLVTSYGILTAGWWSGGCYGAAATCLILSWLAGRIGRSKAGKNGEKV